MPPQPPDKNCETGISFFGSLCPSSRANARFADYTKHQICCLKVILTAKTNLVGTELDSRFGHDFGDIQPVTLLTVSTFINV